MAVGGEDESKNYLSSENGYARSYFEIWPFGRHHTSRFRWDI